MNKKLILLFLLTFFGFKECYSSYVLEQTAFGLANGVVNALLVKSAQNKSDRDNKVIISLVIMASAVGVKFLYDLMSINGGADFVKAFPGAGWNAIVSGATYTGFLYATS